jgi:hypothetical protein
MQERKLFSIAPENRFHLDPAFVAQFIGRQPKWGPVGRVTYLRTYSRPLADGGMEDFWQTCQRVVEGVWSIFKQTVVTAFNPWNEDEAQTKAQDMFQRMWDFKWLPPGRGMWFMGTEALESKGSAALNNCGFVSTQAIDSHFSHPFIVLMDFLMLGVGMGFDTRGAGKATIHQPEIDVLGVFQVPDTREGWCLAVETVLNAYAGKNKLPGTFDYSLVRKEGEPLKTFGGTASGPKPLMDLVAGLQAILNDFVGRPIAASAIVDIMNMIGKCVVAGNVRRSSEIALGDPNDTEFLALKDPGALKDAWAKQTEIAESILEYVVWDRKLRELREEQRAYSVLSTEFATLQTRIDEFAKAQRAVLEANEEWAAQQRIIDAHPLFTHRWASNNTVLCDRFQDFGTLAEMTVKNGEPGYGFLDTIRTRGRLIDPPDDKDQYVLGFNPCAEQPLEDNELCCLVETFPTNHDSLEDFLATLKVAYQYAKGVTLVPTHRTATNVVMTRNRRIGTSQAGVFKLYEKLGLQECIRWWDAGYREICKWDKTYSHWLGVPESNRHTTIKPGGTIPLLVGEEGGMKIPTSAYYFRTIRMDHLHPLVQACRDAGYRVEPDRTTPRTMVVYFPVKDEAVANGQMRAAKDVTVWEQANLLVALQTYWSDNMVSATINFQPHEAQDIKRVLTVYADRLKTISFLPLSDHGYLQAPYIPCTKEEYENAVARLKPLVIEGVDTHMADEKYCSGGLCEIPVRAS